MFTYRSIRSMLQNLPISPPRFVENPNDRDTYRNLIQATVCIGHMSIGILLWKSWGVGSPFSSLPPNKINTLKASLLKDLVLYHLQHGQVSHARKQSSQGDHE